MKGGGGTQRCMEAGRRGLTPRGLFDVTLHLYTVFSTCRRVLLELEAAGVRFSRKELLKLARRFTTESGVR